MLSSAHEEQARCRRWVDRCRARCAAAACRVAAARAAGSLPTKAAGGAAADARASRVRDVLAGRERCARHRCASATARARRVISRPARPRSSRTPGRSGSPSRRRRPCRRACTRRAAAASFRGRLPGRRRRNRLQVRVARRHRPSIEQSTAAAASASPGRRTLTAPGADARCRRGSAPRRSRASSLLDAAGEEDRARRLEGEPGGTLPIAVTILPPLPKLASRVPSFRKRASAKRLTPPTLDEPPTMILPSASIATALARPPGNPEGDPAVAEPRVEPAVRPVAETRKSSLPSERPTATFRHRAVARSRRAMPSRDDVGHHRAEVPEAWIEGAVSPVAGERRPGDEVVVVARRFRDEDRSVAVDRESRRARCRPVRTRHAPARVSPKLESSLPSAIERSSIRICIGAAAKISQAPTTMRPFQKTPAVTHSSSAVP